MITFRGSGSSSSYSDIYTLLIMKILHVGKYYPPENGGIESVLYECVQGMRLLGHNVDVICATNDPKLNGIQTEESGARIFRHRSFGTYFRTSLAIGLISELRRIVGNYDVISIHLPNPLPVLGLIGIKNLPPIILHWHADVSDYGIAYKAYAPFERFLLERCHAIVVATNAHFTTSSALTDYAHKIREIPYGITTSKLYASRFVRVPLFAELTGKKIVFSLGRFVPYKGFDVLIKAAALLPDDYVVIIGGDGPERETCQASIDQLGLSHKVRLPGMIPDNELGAYFQNCSVFCLPSVTQAEAFGVVLIEAMAFGKPVVTSKLGNGVDLVAGHGETGLTIPAGDPFLLSEGLLSLMECSQKYANFSVRAKERFEREFTSNIMSQRLDMLYQDVTSGAHLICS
jgi:glycosyltransferase involved in cell wall biosynthesis